MTPQETTPSDPARRPMPSAERTQTIARALQDSAPHEHHVPTDDGYIALPVVVVANEALVYRADNGRVVSELAHAAEAQSSTLTALKGDAESAEVQTLLERLLLDKARDPDGPIYDELAHYARQTEPLLIASDGLVVNGNRRLAAMRRLHAHDPHAYAGFAQVTAAVLPADISRDKLEYIEAALQMAPELKLSYSWINRRLKLRQHVADLDREKVAKAYRFQDAEAVDVELEQLALAEEYLAWRGTPGAFGRVERQEDRFVQLTAQLRGLKADHMIGLWKHIGFALISASDDLERAIDHYYPFTPPVPGAIVQWVPRAMASELGLAEPQPAGQVQHVKPDLAQQLRAHIDDPERATRTARSVMGLVDTLKSNESAYLGPQRVVHHLRMARDAIEALGPDNIPERQTRRIEAEMAALRQHVTALQSDRDDARPMSRARERRLPGAARWLVRKARTVMNG